MLGPPTIWVFPSMACPDLCLAKKFVRPEIDSLYTLLGPSTAISAITGGHVPLPRIAVREGGALRCATFCDAVPTYLEDDDSGSNRVLFQSQGSQSGHSRITECESSSMEDTADCTDAVVRGLFPHGFAPLQPRWSAP